MKNFLSDNQIEFLLSVDDEGRYLKNAIELPGLNLEFLHNQLRKSTKSLQKMVDSCKGYVKVEYLNLSLQLGKRDIQRQYLLISLTAKGRKVLKPVKELRKAKEEKEQAERQERTTQTLNSAARQMFGKSYDKCGKRQQDAIIRDLAGWTG